jgi:hypothetical protein
MIDTNLLDYCTDRQKEYINAINECGSIRAAARKLNIGHNVLLKSLKSIKKKAAIKGYSPKYDMTHKVPDPFIVNGVSTLYDKDGSVLAQWVKTKLDRARLDELAKSFVESYLDELPKFDPIKINKSSKYEKSLVVYPLADVHVGMLSWWKETSEDYDTYIAEGIIKELVTKMISRSPNCEECLIANLGDFLHVDNQSNMTERSGNILDTDSRYAKIYRVGIRLIRYCIEYALAKHKKVHVINSIGNHDNISELILSVALSNIYEKESRVVIHDEPTNRHYYKYGNSLIGVTHGCDAKLSDLPLIMATEEKESWGKTKYHYWYTGHLHKDKVSEFCDCKVEIFRTIAAKDAWSKSKGYLSGRDLKTIIIDPDYGEVERYIFNIDSINIDKYKINKKDK